MSQADSPVPERLLHWVPSSLERWAPAPARRQWDRSPGRSSPPLERASLPVLSAAEGSGCGPTCRAGSLSPALRRGAGRRPRLQPVLRAVGGTGCLNRSSCGPTYGGGGESGSGDRGHGGGAWDGTRARYRTVCEDAGSPPGRGGRGESLPRSGSAVASARYRCSAAPGGRARHRITLVVRRQPSILQMNSTTSGRGGGAAATGKLRDETHHERATPSVTPLRTSVGVGWGPQGPQAANGSSRNCGPSRSRAKTISHRSRAAATLAGWGPCLSKQRR